MLESGIDVNSDAFDHLTDISPPSAHLSISTNIWHATPSNSETTKSTVEPPETYQRTPNNRTIQSPCFTHLSELSNISNPRQQAQTSILESSLFPPSQYSCAIQAQLPNINTIVFIILCLYGHALFSRNNSTNSSDELSSEISCHYALPCNAPSPTKPLSYHPQPLITHKHGILPLQTLPCQTTSCPQTSTNKVPQTPSSILQLLGR